MPEKILVAVDGSEGGEKALRFAAEISAKIGGDLTIVHVMMHGKSAEEMERLARVENLIKETAGRVVPDLLNPPPNMVEYLSHPQVDRARAVAEIGSLILLASREDAEAIGARNVETEIRDGDYADAILDTASDIGADLIVVGQRGLGRLRSLILGSVSNKIIQNAGCSVLTVH